MPLTTDRSTPAPFASFAQAAMEAQRRANLDPQARVHYVGIFPGEQYRVDYDLGALVARGAVGIETFQAEGTAPAAGILPFSIPAPSPAPSPSLPPSTVPDRGRPYAMVYLVLVVIVLVAAVVLWGCTEAMQWIAAHLSRVQF